MQMHPETKRGMAGALAKKGFASDTVSFAKVVAEKRGLSERHVQRMAAAGRMLGRDAVELLRGSGKAVEVRDVLAIAKVGDASRRARAIELFSLNEAKSVRAALKADLGAEAAPVKDAVEAGFKALVTLWGRVPQKARRQFVAAHRDALLDLIGDAGGGGADE